MLRDAEERKGGAVDAGSPHPELRLAGITITGASRILVVGLTEAPRRPYSEAGGALMKQFDAISKFPEVVAAVVSDTSGSLLEWSGNIDGEAAGAVHSFSLQSLAQAGELLGLGALERTSIVGPTKACILTIQGDEVLGVYADPGKTFSAVEKKIDATFRR